ncbi:MAG: hypothetical protein A2V79_07765 [Betaproteobacteria bacterium RBG_16_56_24]|nr:MAG: hypothetical protein A2V79_07765 [Betaproteobacteria bacterium RBG_16_56_24]
MDGLAVRVRERNLLCRGTPAQKNRVILSLKAQGHTVGYLGDGINDAPSLRSADVGISVDSAVDAAKAAADMIMLGTIRTCCTQAYWKQQRCRSRHSRRSSASLFRRRYSS